MMVLASLYNPRAPTYLNSRLLGYVTIGYMETSSCYLGTWSPRASVVKGRPRICFGNSSGCCPGKLLKLEPL